MCGTVRNDSRHGVSATMVVIEYLTQKSPDGRDRAEHSVPKFDAMVVKNVPDASLGHNVREWESLIARKAGAHRIQARH